MPTQQTTTPYRPAAHTRVPNPLHLWHEQQHDQQHEQQLELHQLDQLHRGKHHRDDRAHNQGDNQGDEDNGHATPRKRWYMPRFAEPTEMTPFALVLTDYMWNKRPGNRPPMNTPQLAVRLGVPRQSVNNWIYKGNVPPLEAILAILAQLDIPLRALYDAYKDAGLRVPRWDENDQEQPQTTTGKSVAERTKKQTAIPITQAPAPRPYVPPAQPYDPQAAEAAEWQRISEQTATAMREAGMPAAEIEQVMANLRARQADASPMQAHLIAEHHAPAAEPAEEPGDTPNTSSKRSPSRSSTPEKHGASR